MVFCIDTLRRIVRRRNEGGLPMTNAIDLLAPSIRGEPNATEFAQFLAERLPDWATELRDYAWDAEAADLAKHLESL
jgi:hypothetical protein